jgi:phosphate:Na+ symporter
MTFLDVTVSLGGLAIFLHGLSLAKEGLQSLAGDKLRAIIIAMTRNRVVGLLSGAAVTVIIQSSTATTVMLVGFAGSGVLSLTQAMSVLLGADIGTTITVQLLSFRLSAYALLITFLGFALKFIAKKRRPRYLGDAVLGFGMLFYGLKLMAEGTAPLTQQAGFATLVAYFGHNPILGILAAAAFTILLQGSAPTIGLLLSLAHSTAEAQARGNDGFHFTLTAALPMVLGANVGTTVTPALSAMGQAVGGRRVAIAHVLFKVLGVSLFVPFLDLFGELVKAVSSGDLSRQIANAHTLFNVIVALLFLPFEGVAAFLIERFYRPPTQEQFGPKYLDPRAIDTPPLAFGLATREFMRMCDIVGDMLKDVIRVLHKSDADLVEDIAARDDKVDILNREIRLYLARLGQQTMTPEQADRQMSLITLTADIENVGDTIEKNLLPMARKMAAKGVHFSSEGTADIGLFHQKVCENFDLAVAAFSTTDEELARKVLRHRDGVIQIEAELKQKHIARLSQGLQETLDTSSFHLDVLSYLRRVNFLVSNLAEAVMAAKRHQAEGRG